MVVRGKYLEKHIECPYCHGDIVRPEEKKTDVNISVRMIGDCLSNLTDGIVLISADSDLIPPLEFIKTHFPKISIKVYFPPSNISGDIDHTLLSWGNRPIRMDRNFPKFLSARMPDIVSKDSLTYTKPTSWGNH